MHHFSIKQNDDCYDQAFPKQIECELSFMSSHYDFYVEYDGKKRNLWLHVESTTIDRLYNQISNLFQIASDSFNVKTENNMFIQNKDDMMRYLDGSSCKISLK